MEVGKETSSHFEGFDMAAVRIGSAVMGVCLVELILDSDLPLRAGPSFFVGASCLPLPFRSSINMAPHRGIGRCARILSTGRAGSISRLPTSRYWAKCRNQPLRKFSRVPITSCSGAPSVFQFRQYATESAEQLQKTPLYDYHVENGGKMVPFGGFSMPVQYEDQTIAESHNWTRTKASLFDVSHMYESSIPICALAHISN